MLFAAAAQFGILCQMLEIPKEELMAIIEEAMFARQIVPQFKFMAFLIPVTEKEQKEALYEVSMQQPAVKAGSGGDYFIR